MAMGTLHVTAPVIAAAVGIFVLDRMHYSNPEVTGGESAGTPNRGSLVGKAKEKVKSREMVKVAPQFDGLYYFETLVAH